MTGSKVGGQTGNSRNNIHDLDGFVKAAEMNIEGSLIALKTRMELRAENSMLEVYIAKVPIKAANKVLK
jgi:hypothetical protein